MTRILLDAALLAKLNHLQGPLELCDSQGQVRARVFPAVDPSQYEPQAPPINEEELRRREQAGERRYKTAEVLALLEKL